jgi:hypothetical protein
MSNGQLERLIYYKGQLLTPRDFEDQQEYHRNKLQQFVQRFPYGIIKGLNVLCDLPKDPPNDFEALKITEGFAVDESGNAIVVGSEGLRIRVDEFDQKKPKDKDHLFLSLRYIEKKGYIPNSSYDSSNKNNRITESVNTEWDEVANRSLDGFVKHITLAKIRLRKNDESIDNKKTCRNGELIIEEDIENQTIRLDAGILEEEQLSDELKKKLVTDGDKHNHTGAHETRIPEGGLGQAVQNKLVTGGDEHNHTGDGARIPEAGLADEVTAQLVTQGDSHDHTDGHGAPIPEGGLTRDVQDKLVKGGSTHDHNGTGGSLIPVAGLSEEVQEKLVTSSTVTPDEGDTTIPAGMRETGKAIINRVEKNAIIHIVPTRGVISWTFTVEPNEEFLKYTISVENPENTDAEFEVRKFVFGAG